jgi:putative DNA methylase
MMTATPMPTGTAAPVKSRTKLIEVALPLEAINEAAGREKSIRHGHPSTLHLWWARRPLAAARAVIFAQMVDDPSACPEEFPTEAAQEAERQRLFRLLEQLVLWENTTNEGVLELAREEIRRSWRRCCADNAAQPDAATLFNPDKLPGFHDPFAGGGALPLEAQRLGLDAHASDLNPVAVLINKAMIEIPPRFAGRAPVNPATRGDRGLFSREWRGAQGLAEDVRYYGQWMRDEAQRRIGHLYPTVLVTADMVRERPDLAPYEGQELTVIAWLWARTVKSPNPAFATVDVPLASTFMLSTKAGKEAYVDPVVEKGGYRFTVKVGKPKDPDGAKAGTKLARGANFRCLMSGAPIAPEHIYAQANAGGMGARLMAIVAEGTRGRVYIAPTAEHEAAARLAEPTWKPDVAMPENPRWFSPPLYGLKTYGDLFTPRQLVALTTFADLVEEARERIRQDALNAGLSGDDTPLRDGGAGALAYAEAICVYLGLGVSKLSDYNASLVQWSNSRDQAVHVFGRQSLPMVWDYAEVAPFSASAGDFQITIRGITRAIENASWSILPGKAVLQDAQTQKLSLGKCVSTDPPYYDNIGYADLSDYFFVWMKRSLSVILPELLAGPETPKSEELVATPYRHGGKDNAEAFFLAGMKGAMSRLATGAHPAFPVTIYYAFKQSEDSGDAGQINTGWDTFLEAVIQSGFGITGTWPTRTERQGRMIGNGTNALASSIVLVCHRHTQQSGTTTRREFITTLKAELPVALEQLRSANIAPVDLAQAAIGPGMAIYTRNSKVLDAQGKPVSVREALALINQTLDEILSEQEGDFDADSRWALSWFEQFGFDEGEYGVALVLAQAKNTGMNGLAEAGLIRSGQGKVRLLRPSELPVSWDPTSDARLTAWESVHHLVRALSTGGETAAAALVAKLGGHADVARELCYRLYTQCERKKRAAEAMDYNGLVQAWPAIMARQREMAAEAGPANQLSAL